MIVGKVYFVAAPGRIKIGYTRKPDQRLAQLQAVDMEPLTAIAVIPGTRDLERRLHQLAEPHRLRGEWFSDCAAIRSIIDRAVSGEFPCDDEQEKVSSGPDARVAQAEVLRAATGEAKRLLAEIERRVANKENVSEMVQSACFLGEKIIAPLIGGLDRT